MSSSAASSATQTLFALTTTFTPAAPTCTQSFWTLLGPSKSYNIYLNYPVPVPQSTFSACYPSQFMSSYLAQQSVVTPLPAIQPLICPVGYASVSIANAPDGYLACCPSSMGLALSSPTQSGRPAFGATCYKAITSITVTAYGDQSVTATSVWQTPAAIGAQAYAFPIEGYAYVIGSSSSSISQASSTAVASLSSQSSTSASNSAAPPSTSSSSSSSLPSASSSYSNHTGAIVGGVIGGLAFLALLALGIFFCLRRRRTKNTAAPSIDYLEKWSNESSTLGTATPHHNLHQANSYRSEMMSVSESDARSGNANINEPVHEMIGSPPATATTAIKRKPLESKAELPGDSAYHEHHSLADSSTISPES